MTASIQPGTAVKIKDAGLSPSIGTAVGRRGVTERPEKDGCYVRFPDNSYMFFFWAELTEVKS